jgi:hypothetical protein
MERRARRDRLQDDFSRGGFAAEQCGGHLARSSDIWGRRVRDAFADDAVTGWFGLFARVKPLPSREGCAARERTTMWFNGHQA